MFTCMPAVCQACWRNWAARSTSGLLIAFRLKVTGPDCLETCEISLAAPDGS